jgi:hypothetical protein
LLLKLSWVLLVTVRLLLCTCWQQEMRQGLLPRSSDQALISLDPES